MIDYLKSKNNFGLRVEISQEDLLLDTGGGLKKAAWFFLEDGSADPFILHNVDVISTIDLGKMLDFHQRQQALATVAVQERQTSRYLLFDQQMELCGRRIVKEQKTEMARPAQKPRELAFTGIHFISPRLLEMMSEDGVFSIIEIYLRLAGLGEKISGYEAAGAYWRDLGKPENIAAAAQDLKEKIFTIGRA
jgi:NDP-sugar pyrophosphorylase family protein